MIYLNGEFMPIEDAKISVLDRGFIFGDGVYEVIPVYRRKPYRLKARKQGFGFDVADARRLDADLEDRRLLEKLRRRRR